MRFIVANQLHECNAEKEVEQGGKSGKRAIHNEQLTYNDTAKQGSCRNLFNKKITKVRYSCVLLKLARNV